MADTARGTCPASAPAEIDQPELQPVSPAIENGIRIDRALGLLSSVVVLGTIMAILDMTIVNVALHTLGRDLNATLTSVQWVATGYLLAMSTVSPLAGWAVERFGARKVWIISIVLFLAGSTLSGLAWSIDTLVGFRVLQGLGGGMIVPVGQTILAQAAGPERMGRLMSIVGVPMMLGPVLGPVLGGFLVQEFTWRWIFFVNLPIGAFAVFLAVRLLPKVEVLRRSKLDFLGLVLLSPGLALLVYGLSQITSVHGTPGVQAISLIVGPILIGLFVVHARRRSSDALIDMRLFQARGFTAAFAVSFVLSIGLFGSTILLPLYYQVVRGQGALSAGFLIAPQAIGAACLMPIGGRLTDRLGARKVVITGIAFLSVGTLPFVYVGADTPSVLITAALLVRGVGLALTVMPAFAAAYGGLRKNQVPRASTALSIVQRVGGAIGTAVLAVLLNSFTANDLRSSNIGHAAQNLSAISSIPPGLYRQAAPVLARAFQGTYVVVLALTLAAVMPALLLPRLAGSSEVSISNTIEY
jgi:EmrB/QacA subfamily drug resistance transporter